MRIFKVLCLLVFFVVSAACSGTEASQPAAATPQPVDNAASEPVTITWGYWGDPWEVAINEKIVEVFEKDNPHINVETFHRPWNDYFSELRPKFENGEPTPDVLFWAQAPIDVPKGYFLDVGPRMEAENYDLEDFFPGLLIHFRMGDSVYGLPRDSDSKVIFYNKRLFNRADVPFPKDNWTWDDLRETALAVQQSGMADYAFAYEANNWWMIWMWQNDVTVFDDKLFPTKTFLGEPAAAEAIQFAADLTNVDKVTPPYEVMLSSENMANLFREQKLAMAFGNHALVPAFADIDEFEWDVVNLPKQKRAGNLAAGAGYVISANTEHPDEAWEFLKFLGSPKGQAIFAESGVVVPARRSVAQSAIFTEQKPKHNAQAFLGAVESGEPNPAFPGANEIIEMMNNVVLPPVYRGEQDAASAIQAALPEIEDILEKSQPPKQ